MNITKCENRRCTIINKSLFNGFCKNCYIYTYQSSLVYQNFRYKEVIILEYLKKVFSNIVWFSDKNIEVGSIKRNPDFLLAIDNLVIIIEIGKQHDDANYEKYRLTELLSLANNKKLIFIRFNMESYKNKDTHEIIESCWKISKKSGCILINNSEELKFRIHELINEINFWIIKKNNLEFDYDIIHLFFN